MLSEIEVLGLALLDSEGLLLIDELIDSLGLIDGEDEILSLIDSDGELLKL